MASSLSDSFIKFVDKLTLERQEIDLKDAEFKKDIQAQIASVQKNNTSDNID
jgi:hypothetical protein